MTRLMDELKTRRSWETKPRIITQTGKPPRFVHLRYSTQNEYKEINNRNLLNQKNFNIQKGSIFKGNLKSCSVLPVPKCNQKGKEKKLKFNNSDLYINQLSHNLQLL